jgi:hypothetical protein
VAAARVEVEPREWIATLTPVGFVDDGADLVLGQGLHIAPGRIGDLDQIDAAPALLAGLEDKCIAGVAQHTCGVGRAALIGRIGVGIENTAVIGEGAGGNDHARPLQEPGVDRLAHRHIGKPFASRNGDARDPGA